MKNRRVTKYSVLAILLMFSLLILSTPAVALSNPTVTTYGATGVTTNRAMLSGSIDRNGGSYISEYGFCWGLKASNPENKEVIGTAHYSGSFSVNLSNLSPGTTYYFYAYAKSNNGKLKGVGQILSFQTDTRNSAPTITLDSSSLSLLVGEKETIEATVSPASARDDLTWSSSDTSVATVSSSGRVKGIAAGKATITATLGNGISASCRVSVSSNNAVFSVSLNKTSLSIPVGSSETLTATVNPVNAANKKVVWNSDNTSIAAVDGNGKVTGIRDGNAVITVTTKEGNKTAQCRVKVTPSTAATTFYETRYLSIIKTRPEKIQPMANFSFNNDTIANNNGYTICNSPLAETGINGGFFNESNGKPYLPLAIATYKGQGILTGKDYVSNGKACRIGNYNDGTNNPKQRNTLLYNGSTLTVKSLTSATKPKNGWEIGGYSLNGGQGTGYSANSNNSWTCMVYDANQNVYLVVTKSNMKMSKFVSEVKSFVGDSFVSGIMLDGSTTSQMKYCNKIIKKGGRHPAIFITVQP